MLHADGRRQAVVVAGRVPKQDKVSGTNIDQTIVTANEIHMIAGVPLKIDLKSDNVIHSFWIPELGGKQDVIPGRQQHITFYADKPGTYLGACAEYCGLSHANMRMRVIAQTRDRVQRLDGRSAAWVRRSRGRARSRSSPARRSRARTATSSTTRRRPPTARTSRTSRRARTFAGGEYRAEPQNLVDWILNAPGMVADAVEDVPGSRRVPGDGASGCRRSPRTPRRA